MLYRPGGHRAVLAHAAAMLGYRKVAVYRLELESPSAPVEPRVDVSFGWLEPAELSGPARLRVDVGDSSAEALLERGDRCYVARLDGNVVSSRWVTTGPAHIDSMEIRMELARGSAYVHDAFTSEDHRGLRVAPAAATRLARLLAAEGCGSIVAFVETGNPWAVRNAEHSGYRRMGVLAKLVLGRWHVPVYRSPGLEAGFVNDRRRAGGDDATSASRVDAPFA